MTEPQSGADSNLFPSPVGEQLRVAREALGLSLAEVGARTRIPLRHLEAIETANYGGLPSPTYAIGFVRAYARAVGADEVKLAREVRGEVANAPRSAPAYQPYEMADPARVPSRGVVIVAAGLGLAVVILAILWFAGGMIRGATSTPEAETPSVAVAAPAAAPAPSPTPARGGQVTLAATDEVWLQVRDGDATLYTGTMKAGDRFDVPVAAKDPRLNVGRPDKLTITLNGSNLPPLGDGSRPIANVRIGAEALAARRAAAAGETAPATPVTATAPTPSASPTTTASRPVPSAFSPSPRATERARPRPRPAPTRTSAPDGPENLLPKGFESK